MSTKPHNPKSMGKTLRILTVGDPHFRPKFVRETRALVTELLRLAKDVDVIVILGDILHDHSDIDLDSQVQAANALRALAAIRPTYVLIGNHDLDNNEVFLSSTHSLNLLQGSCQNLTIVDHPMMVTVGGFPLLFTPFVPCGRFREALDHCPLWQTSKLIFAHQEIRKVRISKSTISEDGDVWQNDWPMLVSGHIHTFQQLAHNILYPGTPYSTNFGELDEKSVTILTVTDQEITHEQVQLAIPRLIKVEINLGDDDTLSQLLTITYPQQTRLKVRIHGSAIQCEDFQTSELRKKLASKFALTIEKIVKVDTNTRAVELAPNTTYADAFVDYLGKNSKDHLIDHFLRICLDNN